MISRPGTYALILKAEEPFVLSAGRLGPLKGIAGYYIYCGSAFGPGGLRARTAHHLRPAAKPHWHIDYLRTAIDVVEVWFSCDPTKREHDWIHALLDSPDRSIPFPGFGSSDCSCRSHLVFAPEKPSYFSFTRKVHRLFTSHATVSRFNVIETESDQGA